MEFNNYNEYLDYLQSIADLKYRDFHKSLVPGMKNIIGIKIPDLKKIAKEISKSNYTYFMDSYYERVNKGHEVYFEEDIITSQLIGIIPRYYANDYEEFIKLLTQFDNRITNWSICDTMCASFKIVQKHKPAFFEHINRYITSDNEWLRRVGVVCMLDWYLTDEYIDRVLNRIDNMKTGEYYVDMAIAWLIATAFAKCPLNTRNYLLSNNNLSDVIIKKALQKMRDSRRIPDNDKKEMTEYFKALHS